MAESQPTPPSDSPEPARRTWLRGAAGLVLAWMTPVHAASQEARDVPPAVGDWLVKVGDTALIPLTPDDLPLDGRALMAWPLSPQGDVLKNGTLNRIVLARLNPGSLSGLSLARAVDDIVAYSAICTHNGCEVDDTMGESQTIFCSCHSSTFDPRDSGAVIGGPAPRSLPALPLKVVDGRLVVASGFTTPAGYGAL